MPSIILFGGKYLRKFEYRKNELGRMTGNIIVTIPNSIVSLDVSDNGITCFSPDVFNISLSLGGNLFELDLPSNSLAGQLETDLSGMTFKELKTLKILHLARNQIFSLRDKTFSHLEMMKKLNLSQNYLKIIDFEFSHMRQLSYLYVSYNLSSSLEPDITRKLSNLFESNNPRTS